MTLNVIFAYPTLSLFLALHSWVISCVIESAQVRVLLKPVGSYPMIWSNVYVVHFSTELKL